jgi:hypothetical protein
MPVLGEGLEDQSQRNTRRIGERRTAMDYNTVEQLIALGRK